MSEGLAILTVNRSSNEWNQRWCEKSYLWTVSASLTQPSDLDDGTCVDIWEVTIWGERVELESINIKDLHQVDVV